MLFVGRVAGQLVQLCRRRGIRGDRPELALFCRVGRGCRLGLRVLHERIDRRLLRFLLVLAQYHGEVVIVLRRVYHRYFLTKARFSQLHLLVDLKLLVDGVWYGQPVLLSLQLFLWGHHLDLSQISGGSRNEGLLIRVSNSLRGADDCDSVT